MFEEVILYAKAKQTNLEALGLFRLKMMIGLEGCHFADKPAACMKKTQPFCFSLVSNLHLS